MEQTTKKKFNFYDNYLWFFLGLFCPIIAVVVVYFWHNKYQKTTKGLLIGTFFTLAFLMIFGTFYGK